jgi:hypothetical protein
MSLERILALLLVTPLAMAQQAREESVFEPGVQHVCVPAADGEGWDCGTVDAPPENYTPAPADAAPEGESEAPPPPPFLADPTRDTLYAPVAEPIAEPATAAEAVIAVEQAAKPDLAAVPEPEPSSAADAGPVAQPVAEPSPPLESTAAPEPATAAMPAVASTAALGDVAAFARLPATAFTLQLAYAPTPADFPRLVAELGLDPATCYALRVRGANGPTWLLAHGAYPDAATGKAAQARLPRIAGLAAQWPRRIGALQTEITQGQ